MQVSSASQYKVALDSSEARYVIGLLRQIERLLSKLTQRGLIVATLRCERVQSATIPYSFSLSFFLTVHGPHLLGVNFFSVLCVCAVLVHRCACVCE